MHRYMGISGRYVGMIALLIFSAGPFIWLLLASLQPLSNLIGLSANVFAFSDASGDNYANLLSGTDYGRWFLNSGIVVSVVIVSNLIFDTVVAYPLARLRFRGQNVILVFVIAGIMIPPQVILVALYFQMRDLGLLNTYMALMLPYLVSPTGIFLLRQHFVTLPRELDEAAAVDGASRFRTLVSIIVPNSLAMLGTVTVLKVMWTWGEFAWPSIAVSSDAMKTVPVGLAGLSSEYQPRWDLMLTGSVLAVIPIFVLFVILQKYFVRGLSSGAVKG